MDALLRYITWKTELRDIRLDNPTITYPDIPLAWYAVIYEPMIGLLPTGKMRNSPIQDPNETEIFIDDIFKNHLGKAPVLTEEELTDFLRSEFFTGPIDELVSIPDIPLPLPLQDVLQTPLDQLVQIEPTEDVLQTPLDQLVQIEPPLPEFVPLTDEQLAQFNLDLDFDFEPFSNLTFVDE